MADTIAAIATPPAVGGISIIRISGKDAIAIGDRVFIPANGKTLAMKKGYTACYGRINWNGVTLDEAVALVFRGPRSYTGEDVVELSCHGGIYSTREILRAVLDCGARLAEAGEFTKRAFLNGKLSLTQAEAVSDLIQAANAQALKASQAQLNGALAKKIQAVLDRLLTLAGHLSAWVDYPEEDLPEVEGSALLQELIQSKVDLEELLSTFDAGRMIREGINTVIIGKPNVGKSTLMNLLAGCRRSIVTEFAGTTRDVIEDCVILGEIMLRLADTAGIRKTEDPVERLGVQIAEERLETAELILAVFDGSKPLEEEDHLLMERLKNKPVIAVINKMDLESKIESDPIQNGFGEVLFMSALEEGKLHQLEKAIQKKVGLLGLDAGGAMLATERQRECAMHADNALKETIESLKYGMTLDAVTVELEEAVDALLELSGKRVTEEVVNQVFLHFCVGK